MWLDADMTPLHLPVHCVPVPCFSKQLSGGCAGLHFLPRGETKCVRVTKHGLFPSSTASKRNEVVAALSRASPSAGEKCSQCFCIVRTVSAESQPRSKGLIVPFKPETERAAGRPFSSLCMTAGMKGFRPRGSCDGGSGQRSSFRNNQTSLRACQRLGSESRCFLGINGHPRTPPNSGLTVSKQGETR